MAGKKKTLPWGKGLLFLLGILGGGLCGLALGSCIDTLLSSGHSPGQSLVIFGLILLGFGLVIFLQIIIHEGGHLIFGLLSGYRFCSFRVASFMVVKLDGKLRFKRLSLAGTGGQCLMEPPEMVDGRFPFVLYNLGGSLLNLISAGLCLGLYLLTKEVPYLPLFCLMGAAIGAVFALTNGIPLKLGAVNNDGHNALSMGKDPAALESFWLQLKINALSTQGVRLRDMPEEWFSVPDREGLKNPMTAVRGVFACSRHMDAHRFQEARDLITNLLSGDAALMGVHENLITCDLIYCELLLENRREKLDRLLSKSLKKFMKAMKNYPAVLRTEYAYALLAEQDEEKAAERKARFEKTGLTYPLPGDWAGEAELVALAEIKSRSL